MLAFLARLFPVSPLASGLSPAGEPMPEASKDQQMKIAQFFAAAGSALAGVVQVALADVDKVFADARAAVTAAPLPANIKADLTQTLTDAQGDIHSAASLAGTLVGEAVSAGVQDITTLFLNTATAVSNAKSLSDLSAGEKTVLAQSWATIRAQGDTLLAQAMAGIDPTKPKPAS